MSSRTLRLVRPDAPAPLSTRWASAPATERSARCQKCKRWRRQSQLSALNCPACSYTTARCEECGGEAGTLRSVFAHFGYWRRHEEGGGHRQRLGAWVREVIDDLKKNR